MIVFDVKVTVTSGTLLAKKFTVHLRAKYNFALRTYIEIETRSRFVLRLVGSLKPANPSAERGLVSISLNVK